MNRDNLWLVSLGAATLTAAAVTAACRTTEEAADVKDTQTMSYEGELGMKPGVGFEGIFEDVRGTCVEWDGVDTAGAAQTATYDFNLVENHADLARTLNVSSASSIKAAIPESPASVSAKTKFSLGYSYTLNRYSVYIVAQVQVRNETTQLKSPRFKPEIKEMLASGQPDAVDRYRLQCGDSYMSAYTTGGEFFGVLEIKTESEDQQLEVKRDIEAAVAAEGIGEATSESSFAATLKNITKNKTLHVWTYQRGGSGAEQVGMVDSVDAMIARMKAFPGFVTATAAPANYTATFQDYFTMDVPLPTSYREQLLAGQDTMGELAGIQARLVDDRGNIDYIIKHPNSFTGLTAEKTRELQTYRSGIENHMRDIYKTARKCQRKLAECVIPQNLLAIKSPELPPRRTTASTLMRDVVVIKTAIQQIDVDELYDAPFNAPECFIEVRAKARNGFKYKRVVRTPTEYTTPRCNNLSRVIEVPMVVLKEAFGAIGVPEDEGQIEILLMEDDYGSIEQVVGKMSKSYKDLKAQSAMADVLTGTYVTANVEFEVR
jgi:hypothetical protein